MNDTTSLKQRLQRQLGEIRAELELMKVQIRDKFVDASSEQLHARQAASETIRALDEKLIQVATELANVQDHQWSSKRHDILRRWEELRDSLFAARARLRPAA